MDSLLQDLRHSARALLRAPGLLAVVVVTLALGIGGTATIFTAVRAALIAGPPYPDADRIVALNLLYPEDGRVHEMATWSFPKYQTLRPLVTAFDRIAIRRGQRVTVAGGDQPLHAYVEAASADYFSIFGATAVVGRLFSRAEDEPGADPRVLLLSHATWTGRFGGDRAVIGRTVRVNGASFQIAGVLAPDFRGVSGRVDAWIPVQALPALGNTRVLERRWAHSFAAFAHLADGVSAGEARAQVAAAGRVVAAAHPDPAGAAEGWGASAVSLADAASNRETRTLLAVLAGAVLLVLLLAAVNVANMLLARGASREREMVVRAALGAGRGRLVRQLVAESLVLAAAGGAGSLIVAAWGVALLREVLPPATGPNGVLFFDPASLGVDAGVVGFAAALVLATGLAMGLVPALRFSRAEGSEALRSGASTGRGFGSIRRPSLRGALVVAQVALAVILAAGAGLMIRALGNLAAVKPGFEPDGVLSFRFGRPSNDSLAADPAFHFAVLDRLAALPGVRSAALISCVPLSGCYDHNSVKRVEGRPPLPESEQPMVRVNHVSESAFDVLGIPLLSGRRFGPGDHDRSAPVVILSESAARRLFGGPGAVGRSLSISIALTPGETMAQVIGVVGDVKHETLQEREVPDAYVSLRQSPNEYAVLLRAAGDPLSLVPSVRAALREAAPDAPLHEVATLPALVRRATTGERIVGWSLAAFAALALALAAIGIYGVISYAVGRRRREMAVRLALGAAPGAVLRLVLGEGLTLVAIGAAVGLAGALALGGVIASLLYGVAPRDAATLGAALLVLLAVATAATWLPARRAASVDPMTALRAE